KTRGTSPGCAMLRRLQRMIEYRSFDGFPVSRDRNDSTSGSSTDPVWSSQRPGCPRRDGTLGALFILWNAGAAHALHDQVSASPGTCARGAGPRGVSQLSLVDFRSDDGPRVCRADVWHL